MRRLDMSEIIDRMKNMDTKNKVILGATSVAVIGVLAVGGYALSNASSPVSSNKVSTVVKEDNSNKKEESTNEEKKENDKKEENKEDTKKEESTDKKEETSTKEETKVETSTKEETKVETSTNETKKEEVVSNTTTITKPSTNSSSSSQTTTTTKPSTSTGSSNSSNQTSKPSTNTGNSNTTESKPVEQAPVVEQKPVEQAPVVEEKPATPSWWGEGKSEAEIMKTVTDALVWQNVITGETYYGLNGLKFGWNDGTYGGLKLVSNPYGVWFGAKLDGNRNSDFPSNTISYSYDNWDVEFSSGSYSVTIEVPSSIMLPSEVDDLYTSLGLPIQ